MSGLKIITFEFNYEAELKRIINQLEVSLEQKVYLVPPMEVESDLFLNKDRGQYNASKIIEYFEKPEIKHTIILTSLDLFIPIFTYVFGLAKMNGEVGIVSSHRLGNRFYGLPSNRTQLIERVVKEIIHELGHLKGLLHCENFQCVMRSSTSIDDLDIKSPGYCKSCINLL